MVGWRRGRCRCDHDGMTLTTAAVRWSLRTAYVLGAGALGAVLATAAEAGAIPGWLALLIILVYLGPLGLTGLLLVVLPLELIVLLPPLALPVVSAVVAIGAASLNAVILDRWRRRRARGSAPSSSAGPSSGDWDTLLGGALFVLAGCAFVLLCMFAGFAALTAHGIDVRVPDADATRTLVVAGITWWTGLAIAITGLVLWVKLARRGRRLLPWAAADLASMVALISILFLA